VRIAFANQGSRCQDSGDHSGQRLAAGETQRSLGFDATKNGLRRWAAKCASLLNFPIVRQSCYLNYRQTIRLANHLGNIHTRVLKTWWTSFSRANRRPSGSRFRASRHSCSMHFEAKLIAQPRLAADFRPHCRSARSCFRQGERRRM
jgi:hypothetical protein